MKSKIIFFDQKMAITTETGIVFRYYDDLMYILFDKPYCSLYFTGNVRYMAEVPLQYIMDNLPKTTFMICKRSAVLNICYCRELKKSTRMVEMEDGTEINLSKRNMLNFKWMIDNLSCISSHRPNCTDDEFKNHMVS